MPKPGVENKNNVVPIRKELTEEQRCEAEYLKSCDKIQDLQVEIEMLHDNLLILGADVTVLDELRQTMIALELWSEYVDEKS